MSYLLKALKKAEEERKQNVNEATTTPVAQNATASLPKSVLWVAFLLVALTVWQMFFASNDGKRNELIDESEAPMSVSQVGQRNLPLSELAEVESNQHHVAGVTPQEISEEHTIELPAKSLSELSASELSRIPSLNLASHIYSSAAEYRSVVINGQTYQEGDLIRPGLILQEISQNGVIIDLQGLKVSLPKGISWIASQNVK
ncbi:MAG: general secretion pathway protein GspB [Gammaproteobacteria bacterium]|nr:general secretion pathway protein GspB [Gammaproteobacteria bacterium]